MTKRESIQRVLSGERSERLPRALFGAGRWSYRQTGLRIEDLDKDPGRFAGTLAGFFKELDTDIVFPGSGLNTFPAEAIGGELAFNEEQAPLLAAPLIHKTDDARFFGQVDIAGSPRSLALVEMIARLRSRLPDRFLCVTSWGPFTWAMILCDWRLLQEKTGTDKAFIREVCELGVRLSFALVKPLVEKGLIDGVVISDGAATLVPLDLYQEVILPCERKLFDLVKQRGVARFLHQCGKIESQLGLYPDTGADCISLDTGIKFGEAYELYHKRTVIAGNVDVINTILGKDPAGICDAVSECVAGISDPFRKFILMPSCDLPPDTPLNNAKAFLACADRAHFFRRA
jgi:uroporphyrinogen decarboxylase